MLLSGLHSVDFSALRLDGLSGADTLSQQQVFNLMRPLIRREAPGKVWGTNAFTDDMLRNLIANVYAKYVAVKSSQKPSDPAGLEADIRAVVMSAVGAPALSFEDDLRNAFERLGKDGYTLLKPSEIASPASAPIAVTGSLPPSQQTPDNVVREASTPRTGKKPTAIETFQAAMNMVKTIAPLMTKQQQQDAAQKILARSRSGKKVYTSTSKSILPWMVLGVGVVSVIGLGVYFATRKS